MSEYIAIMLGGVGVMFFLYDISFRLVELNQQGERTNEGLALGLLGASMIFGWLVLNLMIEIATDAGLGGDIISATSGMYYFFIVLTVLMLFYFGLKIMFGPIKDIVERRKYKV